MEGTTNEGKHSTTDHEEQPESEDTLTDLEPLEDLDDQEFGLPPIDRPPTLEDILAAEDDEIADEFLEDESYLDSTLEEHIISRERASYSASCDGNKSGSSSVGGGSINSGHGALLRHMGIFAGSVNNEETLSIHSRETQSIGRTSVTGSVQSSVLLHNKKKLERSKASIMR